MSAGRTALLVGGTGPTGPHLIEGLLERGYDVTVFHTGRHETDDAPDVPHVHGDPFSAEGIAEALGGREPDVVVAAYGRVRAIAENVAGRCDQLLVVGGVPVYRGYVNPQDLWPAGLRVPVRETHETVGPEDDAGGRYGVGAIRRTEDAVFALGERGAFRATYFRYPTIYGPRNPHAWEWSIVQRVLDGRPFVLVPDDGRSVHSRLGARNAAHGVLLALDNPEVAAGKAYNIADDEALTMRQWAEVVAEQAGGGIEVRSFPGEVPSPGWGLIAFRYQLTPTCVVDTSRIRDELGYRDEVPVLDGLAQTVAWQLDHAEELRGDPMLLDPFDYEAEDRLVAVWDDCLERLHAVAVPFEEGVGQFRTPQTAKGAKKG